MVRLMNEIMEGWQEMEGKDKVICVVDKACENRRVRREVERLYRNVWIEFEARPLRLSLFDHSAIWGEHPGVYIILYERDVHLKIMNYEL